MKISLGTYLDGAIVNRIKYQININASTSLSIFKIAFRRFLAVWPGDVKEATTPARFPMNIAQRNERHAT
jgi:hypothetical protein